MTATGFPGFEIREFAFAGTTARYLERGSGAPLLLLHGVGPGTSCTGNFRFLLEPLARRHRVFAMDLVGFGLSGRKPEPPYFDFALWSRQAAAMLERIPGERVAVLGHSLSGALALRLAASSPRIDRVLTTGTVGTRYALTSDLERLWSFPESRDDLSAILATIIHDTSKLTDDMLDERLAILRQGDYRAYFTAMFGGDKQRLIDSWALAPEELRRIAARVVLLHGRCDRPCPAEATSLVLAQELPQADIVLLGRCSHSPALEFPEKVLAVAETLFAA